MSTPRSRSSRSTIDLTQDPFLQALGLNFTFKNLTELSQIQRAGQRERRECDAIFHFLIFRTKALQEISSFVDPEIPHSRDKRSRSCDKTRHFHDMVSLFRDQVKVVTEKVRGCAKILDDVVFKAFTQESLVWREITRTSRLYGKPLDITVESVFTRGERIDFRYDCRDRSW
ncbi:MAG: hypothetical protein L6R39_003939 [Caloplaca ligustica]|nr:MAG: hypothetical protein L6R39_003939 [Caloplaca ligustica]